MVRQNRKRFMMIAAMLIAVSQTVLAQSLFSVAKDVADIMEILLGMACIIELGVLIINIMKGERDMVDKSGKWILITAVIFVVIKVVKSAIGV